MVEDQLPVATSEDGTSTLQTDVFHLRPSQCLSLTTAYTFETTSLVPLQCAAFHDPYLICPESECFATGTFDLCLEGNDPSA